MKKIEKKNSNLFSNTLRTTTNIEDNKIIILKEIKKKKKQHLFKVPGTNVRTCTYILVTYNEKNSKKEREFIINSD